ncbi:MAG: response regulator [Humidesulfovibrio sp.]|jgi:DNA-binding NtrC family response regulator|uniref:response regulator n=1 Tax=Humidesulfovibrio sp. TaxID=2910988 RepID=UPI0027362EA4|nr:response regulator [Humidesulfovibrio sp.]MDP2847441.1 response regulator [Humidesulfovibrio sp.]
MSDLNPHQHSILVLDDELRMREALSDFLSDMDYRPTAVGTAQQALDALRSQHFTIAIVAVRLPDMDGITFMTQARAIQPRLRCIIHTGSLDLLSGCDLSENGVEAVLIKPVTDMNRFLDVINGLPGTP